MKTKQQRANNNNNNKIRAIYMHSRAATIKGVNWKDKTASHSSAAQSNSPSADLCMKTPRHDDRATDRNIRECV